MEHGSAADARMELAHFLSTSLPEQQSQDLFELAASDPSIFFTELLGLHRSGRIRLPAHLLKAVTRDFAHLGGQ